MAVLLANALRHAQATAAKVVASGGAGVVTQSASASPLSLGRVLHESFTDGAHLLLLGADAGVGTGPAGVLPLARMR